MILFLNFVLGPKIVNSVRMTLRRGELDFLELYIWNYI